MITYTTINHEARNKLSLSWIEYGLIDIIYHLSNNPKSDYPTWCYASKKYLSGLLGISEQALYKMINRLVDKKLLERHEVTKHIKITIDWYEKVIGKKDTKQSLVPLNKVESSTKLSLVETLNKVESTFTHKLGSKNEGDIYIYNKRDREKRDTSLKETPFFKRKEFLLKLTPQDIEEVSKGLKINPDQVKDKAEDLFNYCEAKGKSYSNYKAFLRNALKRDFPKNDGKPVFRIIPN